MYKYYLLNQISCNDARLLGYKKNVCVEEGGICIILNQYRAIMIGGNPYLGILEHIHDMKKPGLKLNMTQQA